MLDMKNIKMHLLHSRLTVVINLMNVQIKDKISTFKK